MTIRFWFIGKHQNSFFKEGFEFYENRLKHYHRFEYQELPAAREQNAAQVKKKEAEMVLNKLNTSTRLILLDEKGKSFNSREFASWLETQMSHDSRDLIFLIGGAWGFDDALYQRAERKISLSAFTFSHQIARLVFMEQLYRAFTIIRNEPYHND